MVGGTAGVLVRLASMPGFDALAPDQKAVLQLLLKQGKSYGEIAGLLRLDAASVRERALDALDALGADVPGSLSPERQDEVGDHLLLQQTATAGADTRTFLEGSPEARAWARAVADELRPMAGDTLPSIPAEPAEEVEGRSAADRDEPRSSRLGGVLILIAVAAIIAAAVLLVVRSGADDTPRADSAVAAADGPSGTTGVLPQQQINLEPPAGRESKALGYAIVTAEGSFAFQAEGLERSNRYDVWLYNSPEDALPLGFARYDTTSKTLAGAVQLPAEAGTFSSLIITRQTAEKPTRPGTVVLRGPIKTR